MGQLEACTNQAFLSLVRPTHHRFGDSNTSCRLFESNKVALLNSLCECSVSPDFLKWVDIGALCWQGVQSSPLGYIWYTVNLLHSLHLICL